MILFIRKDYGLHRTTAHNSSCFTLVHPNTVSVHLVSREGLQLAGLPLIAWTVTASAAVTEKVRSGKLMLQWSLITCTCTSVSHPYHMAGVLCGSCRNGYGVSALLNKCVTCHDASGMLIAVLSEYQLGIVVESR